MKKITALLIVLSSFSASAMTTGGNGFLSNGFQNNGNHYLSYNTDRKMKTGMKFLTQGLQAYQDGSLTDAMQYFKKSAKLGNEMSKYLVALVHFEQKELVSGYAWLQLLDEPIDHSAELLKKFAKTLNEEQKAIAKIELQDLKKHYDNKLGNHRNKYLADLNNHK